MIEGLDRLSRRQLFKLAGVGALAACSSRPAREILPYAAQPELTPGIATHYASCLVRDGIATGVVVETHEGRPTKIEGNPDHPASLGATTASQQAAVLSLYDPHRARGITEHGVPSDWSQIQRALAAARTNRGAGLHIVMEPTSSPIAIALVARVRTELPAARVTFWAPFEPKASLRGNALVFGRRLQTQLALDAADVIVALDADLVAEHPFSLAHARHIADRRRVVDAHSVMNRLYAIESAYTPTGVIADHRIRIRASEIHAFAQQLLAGTGAIARDLRAARGVVCAGEQQPAAVHALVAQINQAIASPCVSYIEPTVFEAGQASHDLADVRDASTLLVLGGNPAYTAMLPAVANSIYLGLYANETAARCRYLVPGLHDLERWDLARAYDGTLTPQQPMIEPLFGGRSVATLLAELLGDAPIADHDRIQQVWSNVVGESRETVLARGVVANSAAQPVVVTASAVTSTPAPSADYELELRAHPYVYDGRDSNNPWLLELPDPITKLTWDNAAQLSPKTARELAVSTGDIVALSVGARSIEVPVIVVPGHADRALSIYAGFGRTGDEHIAHGVGVAAFPLFENGFTAPVAIARTPRQRALAITQEHWQLEGRDELPTGSLQDASFIAELARQRGPQPTLLPPAPTAGAQWAMSIDLTTCTGCSACVMACSAENNVPVVGRTQVLNRREMHWIRLDRYAVDDEIAIEPMTCQHCEKAPCEYVCPVEATTHSPDGLNEMTYNRCVGTRFCSNNCPYKVRRFNWFDFKQRDSLHILGNNPDVTVRDRGVMEKCTYCVQRIRRAEIDARVSNQPIAAFQTACQQVCPTRAITFGSLTDATSAVREQRGRPHDYTVLHDQGTVPRTHYLARIKNRNPELP